MTNDKKIVILSIAALTLLSVIAFLFLQEQKNETVEVPIVIAIDDNSSTLKVANALVNIIGTSKVETKLGEKNIRYVARKGFSFRPEEYPTLKNRLKTYLPEPAGYSVGIVFVNNSNHEYNNSVYCCESSIKAIVIETSSQNSTEIEDIIKRELNHSVQYQFGKKLN